MDSALSPPDGNEAKLTSVFQESVASPSSASEAEITRPFKESILNARSRGKSEHTSSVKKTEELNKPTLGSHGCADELRSIPADIEFRHEIVYFIGKGIIIGESKPDQQMTGEEFSPLVIESEFTCQDQDDKNTENGKWKEEDLFFFFCYFFLFVNR